MLIRRGRVIDPSQRKDGIYDIRVKDGKIEEIGNLQPEEGEETINAAGYLVAPGFVDVHVHFRDPGQTEKEDLHTGSLAAARGGYTSVVCMANTVPATDSPETVKEFYEKAEKEDIHLYTVAALTNGIQGEELNDLKALKAAGAVGFSDDGRPIRDEELLLKGMNVLRELDMPLSLHEEDPRFIGLAGVNDGEISKSMGLRGASSFGEDLYVARDVIFARMTGCKTDIQHISSGYGVRQVAEARAFGADVVAEVTPHHFTLTEEAVRKYGSLAKMNPPLRTEKDREMIKEGIADGTITILATDHAPHTVEEKCKPFPETPSGIIGLETALGLALRELVKPGVIDYGKMISMMSTAPAKFYNLPGGTLQPGAAADIVIFDPLGETVYHSFLSKSKNSPFLGETLPGEVKYTIADGKIVYRH